jgi:dihydroorotate dehydrogenase electron transfer subunit
LNTALLTVVENARLYGNTYCMWLDAPELMHGAAPGRFLMLRCADPALDGSVPFDPLLPRAMSYSAVRKGKNGDEFSILYDVVGKGTGWLAECNAGDKIFGWGPLGKGFSMRGDGHNLLLVGGGIGIAPMVWLAEEAVARGKSVVVLDGARDASGVYPAEMWPDEVELVVTTQDGSAGRQGLVTDVFLDYFSWSDTVFTCGPNPMFAALADVLRKEEGPQRTRRRKPVQALLESPMGCGTGICYGCAVFDHRGQPRLVCKEGPRFELRDIW